VFFSSTFRTGAALFALSLSAALPLALAVGAPQNGAAKEEKKADPWTNAQVHASDLASELGNSKDASTPVVVYVGFRTLFEGGHVPQASFHGTASKEDGFADLKKWLATLPRSTNLVIYCGCCPFDRCPNIRPAYTAIRDMSFTHVRVLVLPTSFAADWVEKGYPMQKGL
jgi:thiosulfate/3-mercaptopyruvate sulfurtransferase